jgi:putative peptidoglycan lipid II flippase
MRTTPVTGVSTATPSPGSLRHSITIASMIMISSVFLSRVLGMVREMVLASYGGTRSEMDAYVASFLLPEIINHLLAGGFMSVTFIPIFQRHLAQNRRDLAWRAFSNLFVTGSLAIAVLTVLCLVFTEDILGLMGQHIADPHQRALTARMTRVVLSSQIFLYWGALLLAVQYAQKRFFLPALAPLIYNAGIIVVGIVLSPVLGIEGFAWGVLVGSFLGNFVVQAWGARSLGMTLHWRVDLRDPDLRTYVLVTLPLVVGLGMQFSNEVFFRYFGSFLGPGALASLNYALRTMMVLVAVFGQAFGVAAFPYLSQYAAEKRYHEMNALLFSMVSRVAVIIIPFSLLMMVLSKEALAVLFERGRFTAASTLATAPVLSMYCIGAAGLAATNMISRGFYALQRTVLPMTVSTIAALCSLPFYWFFLNRHGAQGIALVGSLFMIGQCVVLVTLWTRQYHGWPELRQLLVTLSKVVAISAAGCLLCFGLARSLEGMSIVRSQGALLRNLLVLCGGGLPAALLIMLAFEWLGIADLRAIISRFSRKRAPETAPTV